MPAIVDKESMRKDILKAFRACIEKKPISKITLRDVAEEAGISHAKILYYFDSRDDMIHEYMRYSRGYVISRYDEWLEQNPRKNFGSDLEYFDSFFRFVVEGDERESQLNTIIQTYVLSHYDAEAKRLLDEEYEAWRKSLLEMLSHHFGDAVSPKCAEALIVVLSGLYILNYNGALTGSINDDVLTEVCRLATLSDEPKK